MLSRRACSRWVFIASVWPNTIKQKLHFLVIELIRIRPAENGKHNSHNEKYSLEKRGEKTPIRSQKFVFLTMTFTILITKWDKRKVDVESILTLPASTKVLRQRIAAGPAEQKRAQPARTTLATDEIKNCPKNF